MLAQIASDTASLANGSHLGRFTWLQVETSFFKECVVASRC